MYKLSERNPGCFMLPDGPVGGCRRREGKEGFYPNRVRRRSALRRREIMSWLARRDLNRDAIRQASVAEP